MYIIEINNLNFDYSGKILFSNLDLKIEKNTFNCLIGNNGCGKTTLLKIMLGLIFSN